MDPFVGTWQVGSTLGLRLVIIRRGGGYVAATLIQGRTMQRVVFSSRHDNQLVARFIVANPVTGKPTGEVLKYTVDFDPQSGHLHYSPYGRFVEFSKLSGSTSISSAAP